MPAGLPFPMPMALPNWPTVGMPSWVPVFRRDMTPAKASIIDQVRVNRASPVTNDVVDRGGAEAVSG